MVGLPAGTQSLGVSVGQLLPYHPYPPSPRPIMGGVKYACKYLHSGSVGENVSRAVHLPPIAGFITRIPVLMFSVPGFLLLSLSVYVG